jgi:hypothetical protein
MSWREGRENREREKNTIYSGPLRLCLQPWAAHALRSDQKDYFHLYLCRQGGDLKTISLPVTGGEYQAHIQIV